MLLYKYLKPEHALLALRLGIVRIGTLAEFRGDQTDDARRDGAEGFVQYVVSEPISGDWENPSPAQRFLSQFGFTGGSIEIFSPGAKSFIHEISALDAYIYCMSGNRSDALMAKFGGSGIVIQDPEGFLRAIGRSLTLEGRDWESLETAECIYKTKVEDFTAYSDARPPIWFVKPTEYSEECEVRAKWSPKERVHCPPTVKSTFVDYPPSLKPIILYCPDIIPFISPL